MGRVETRAESRRAWMASRQQDKRNPTKDDGTGRRNMERKLTQNICVCVLYELCVLLDLCVCNLLEITDKTIIRNSKSLLHTQIVKYARTNRLIHTHKATDQHEGF